MPSKVCLCLRCLTICALWHIGAVLCHHAFLRRSGRVDVLECLVECKSFLSCQAERDTKVIPGDSRAHICAVHIAQEFDLHLRFLCFGLRVLIEFAKISLIHLSILSAQLVQHALPGLPHGRVVMPALMTLVERNGVIAGIAHELGPIRRRRAERGAHACADIKKEGLSPSQECLRFFKCVENLVVLALIRN